MSSGETVRQYNGHHKGLFPCFPTSSSITNYLLKLPFAVLYMMVRAEFFFFFYINNLLHGARWQAVVATS